VRALKLIKLAFQFARPGECDAHIIGVDFPIPIIAKIHKPEIEPQYDTPLIIKRH
jgi:hypothetical protein